MGHRPELRQTAKEWRRILYSRINNLFCYENLPEEINEYSLKLFLNRYGKVIFYKIGKKYLIQPFAYTDKLDWYYIPKFGRVVNPWLPTGHQNYEFEIDKEAVIFNSTPDIYTFKEHSLVADLIHKTSYQLAENDISYYCIQRNHRLIAIFTAENDLQKAECNRVLERIYNGEPDITMGEDLVSHIKVNPIAMNSTRSSITELIEFQQYILANFYHSFGINSNYNLKREQLNSNEIDVNEEVLRLNIEDMLKNRETGVEKINEIYGLGVRVCLNEEVYNSLLRDAENVDNKSEIPEINGEESETGTEEGERSQENICDSESLSFGNDTLSEYSDKVQNLDKESSDENENKREDAGTLTDEIRITITSPENVQILDNMQSSNDNQPSDDNQSDKKEGEEDDTEEHNS